MLINDFTRGKLPYYSKPPGYENVENFSEEIILNEEKPKDEEPKEEEETKEEPKENKKQKKKKQKKE